MSAHIINKQVIELNVKSKENAFAIQQRVREVYFAEVVPLLDEVLSSITAAGGNLYIDRLEVDLGVLNYAHLSREMKEAVRKKIVDQLNGQVRIAAEQNTVIRTEKDGAAALKTEGKSTFDLLRVFFVTGGIPWWADDEQSPPDIDELIVRLLAREPHQLLTLLQQIVVQRASAQRIIFQVSKKVQERLLQAMPQHVVQQVRAALQRLMKLLNAAEPSALSSEETEQLVFIAAAGMHTQTGEISERGTQAIILRSLVEAMSVVIPGKSIRLVQRLYRRVLVALIRQPKQVAELEPFVHYFGEWEQAEPVRARAVTADSGLSVALLVKKDSSSAEQKKLERAVALFLGPDNKPAAARQIRKERTAKSKTKTKASVAAEDENEKRAEDSLHSDDDSAPLPDEILALLEPGAPVFNDREESHLAITRYAGLVLIAPFLPAFFEEMQLLDDGVFRNEGARHKAIHFLNFMATNKTKAPEYSLALHKILCGAELDEPVPKSMKLNADEKKAAILFLDDIAEQWTTLQGTSGEAFRETFMRRNGIIEQRVNALLLRIERAPMDILLDTLPWNISIIRLPWMQQLLHTEW